MPVLVQMMSSMMWNGDKEQNVSHSLYIYLRRWTGLPVCLQYEAETLMSWWRHICALSNSYCSMSSFK